MNMSKENYAKFKSFCDYVLETANDEQIQYLMAVLADACEYAAKMSAKAERKERKYNNGKN